MVGTLTRLSRARFRPHGTIEGFTGGRGTVFKNIILTSKDGEVDCRDGRSTMVLKSEFLKQS